MNSKNELDKKRFLAVVTRSNKRDLYCRLLDENHKLGEHEVLASSLRELIKKNHIVVGDTVSLEQNGSEYIIVEKKERYSEVFRLLPRTQKRKVIAANCDLIVIVASVSLPAYRSGLVDRLLVRAKLFNIHPVVVLNKLDEFDDQFRLHLEYQRLLDFTDDVFILSSTQTELTFNQAPAFLALKEKLQKKRALFFGPSGVGKSKLINALTHGRFALKSGQLAKVKKGAHTTTWVELIDLLDLQVIDSPGMRSLSVEDLSINELDLTFEFLFQYFNQCQFRDCKHGDNSKGCYFYALYDKEVEELSDEELILMNQLESYCRLRDEMEMRAHWEKGF